MKKKLIAYYIVAAIIIVIGFVIGTGKELYSGGYTVYYGDKVPHTTLNGETIMARNSIDIGDHKLKKYVGWYFFEFKYTYEYLIGDDIKTAIVLNYDTVSDMITNGETANVLFDREDFEKVYYQTGGIIGSAIIWVLIAAFPFIAITINKSKKKATVKNNLKKLEELNKMKANGIISEEEYNSKKAEYTDKAKNSL